LSVLIARIHALLRRREWFRKDNHEWGGGATDGRTRQRVPVWW
jgi:hypothetical protein